MSGPNVLATLKNRMQALRDEMDKYRDMYEEKCKEVDDERGKRNTVTTPPPHLSFKMNHVVYHCSAFMVLLS